jgi:hypothetical protein
MMNEQALRHIYENVLPRGKNNKGVSIINTLSYLRMEAVLGTQNSISFTTVIQQGAQNSTERRLSINDSFTVLSFSVFIYKQLAPSGVAQPFGQCKLHTWPNPFVFSGTGEAAALQEIYNGSYALQVNSTQYFQAFDCLRFYRVGVAQQSLDVTAPGSGINAAYGADYWADGHYGFNDTNPTVTFAGTDTIESTITLPDSSIMAGTASNNYCALYMHGYLNQNGADYNRHTHPIHGKAWHAADNRR